MSHLRGGIAIIYDGVPQAGTTTVMRSPTLGVNGDWITKVELSRIFQMCIEALSAGIPLTDQIPDAENVGQQDHEVGSS